MRTVFIIVLFCMAVLPTCALGQEVAVSGFTPDFTEEATIVVTGHRIMPPIEPAYTAYLPENRTEFHSEEIGGRQEFEFRRVLLDEGGFEIDVHQAWTEEGNSADGPRERGRRRFRAVIRF